MVDVSKLCVPKARDSERPYSHTNPANIVFDFNQGTPDPRLFPVDDLLRLARQGILRDGPEVLDYTDQRYGYGDLAMGWSPLRDEISAYIERRDGVVPGRDGVIVTNGSGQAISLAANAFLQSGDAVFVEALSFPFALRFFAQCGAEVIPVPIDADGLDVDALEAAIEEAGRRGLTPKLIYTIATYHLPTAAVLSLERRHRLLALAAEREMLIVEDNIYRCFRYDGEVPPTLLSLDREGVVIQSDGFTKSAAPGIRLGWMAGSPEAIAALATVRQDLGPNQWLCRIMTDYLAEGLFEPHIEKANDLYREKRDAVVRGLDRYCSRWLTYAPPSGGHYFWLELSDDVDWSGLQEAGARRGIAIGPLEHGIGREEGPFHLRMAFVQMQLTPAEIEATLGTLGGVLESIATRSADAPTP